MKLNWLKVVVPFEGEWGGFHHFALRVSLPCLVLMLLYTTASDCNMISKLIKKKEKKGWLCNWLDSNTL